MSIFLLIDKASPNINIIDAYLDKPTHVQLVYKHMSKPLPTSTESFCLTIQEAADFLKVSTKTLRRWESQDLLIPERTPGNQRRYSLNQLQNFDRLAKTTPSKNLSYSPAPLFSKRIFPKVAPYLLALLVLFSGITYAGIKGNIAQNSVSLVRTSLNSLSRKLSPMANHPQLNPAKLASDVQVSSQVLAAETTASDYVFNVNVPSTFTKNITAPNVIYDLTAGQNITITGGQHPTISAANTIYTAGTGISIANQAITNLDPGSAQQIWKTIKINGQSDLTAGSNTDSLTFAAGNAINLTTNTSDKKITIGLSTVPTTSGGTGITSYTEGDILYATTSGVLTKLGIGAPGQSLIVSGNGPSWGIPNVCADCIVKSPIASQIITPTLSTATGLTIAQANLGTVDIFNVTDFSGASKFLSVNYQGDTIVTGNLNVSTLGNSRVVFTDASKNLTTSGTVNVNQGGTGFSSYVKGDLLYAATADTFSRLQIGTDSQVLSSNGGVPEWIDSSLVASNFWQRENGLLSPNDQSTLLIDRTISSDIMAASSSGTNVFRLSSSGVLSLSSTGLLDLGNINPSTSSHNGLRLPQTNFAAPYTTGPIGQEGYISYNTDTQKVLIWNGTTWNDISGASTTLQEAYLNSGRPQFTLTESNSTLTIRDAQTPITSSNLFLIRDYDNTRNYFSVGSAGATISGTTTLNGLTYTWPANQTPAITRVLANDGSGNLDWKDSATVGTNHWNNVSNILFPYQYWSNDLIIGGDSTVSAKFHVASDTGSLSFGSSALIDLSNINPSNTSARGLKLPQNNSLTTGPSAGEGFLAYDNTANKVMVWDGADWVDIAAGTVTRWSHTNHALYPDEYWTDGLLIGGNSTTSARFAFSATTGETKFNGQIYTWPSPSGVDDNKLLQTDSNGNLSWISASSTGIGINYWGQTSDHGLYTKDYWANDVFVGGNSTTSAKIALLSTGVIRVGDHQLTATDVFAEPTLTKGNLTELTSSVLTIGNGSGAVIGSGTTIQVKQAATSQSGFLSSTDWNTFNTKQFALFQYLSGAISPLSSTADLLVGSDATATARFAFSGTTDQSKLGTYTYTWPSSSIGDNKILQTSATGALSWIDSNSAGLNYWSTTADNGLFGKAYWANDLFIGGNSTASAKIAANANGTLTLNSITTPTDKASKIYNVSGSLYWGTETICTSGSGCASTGTVLTSGSPLAGQMTYFQDSTHITGTSNFNYDSTNGISVFNQPTISNDIFTASSSGVTRLTLSGSGLLNIPGLSASSAVYTDANRNLTTTAPISGILGFWQRANGSVAPTNTSDDLIIGSTSTTSAKFAFSGTSAISKLGDYSYTWPSSGIGDNRILQTNSSGVLSWVDANGSGVGTNHWVEDANTLYAKNYLLDDLLIGGNTTASAKFAFSATTGATKLNNQTYNWPTSIGGSNRILSSNSSGDLTWVEANGSGVGTNYWSITNEHGLYPNDYTLNDLFIGGNSTTSAKLAFLANGSIKANSLPTNNSTTLLNISNDYVSQINASAWDQNMWDDVTFGNIATISATLGTNYWQLASANVLSPYNTALDLVVGGTATGSAFQVLASNGNVTAGTYNGGIYNSTKQSNLDTAFTNRITSVAGAGPLSFSIDGTTRALTTTFPAATGSNDGYLTSANWNTFNSKQFPLFQYLAGAISPLTVTDDFLLGANATGTAKLALSGTTGNITSAGSLSLGPTATTAVNNARLLNINSSTGLVSYEDSTAWDRNMWDDVTFGNIATISATLGTNYWQLAGTNLLAPYNSSLDLLVGGTASGSAKFQVTAGTGVVTLSPTGLLDLSNINPASSNRLGFQLPQGSSLSSTGPTGSGNTGKGFLAYDTTDNAVKAWNGSAWQSVANSGTQPTFWSYTGGMLYPAIDVANDLLIGGSSTASAKFQVIGSTGSASMSGALTVSSIQSPIDDLVLKYKSGENSWSNGITLADITGLTTINGDLNVGGTNLNLGTSTSTQTINIGGAIANNNTSTINIGTAFSGTGHNHLTIGNSNDATSVQILAGTGHLALTGASTTNFSIGPSGAYTGTIALGSSSITDGSTANITIGSSATGKTLLTVGDTTRLAGQYPLYFDGATTDTNYTRFAFVDPTSTNTITFPNASGEVCISGVACSGPGAGVMGYWQRLNGGISPANLADDLYIGGTSTASARVRIGSALTSGQAAMIINQTESQDIFTASASGATKFTISNTGALTLAPAGTTAVNNSRILNQNSTTGLVSYEDSTAWDRNMWDDVTFGNLATASASLGIRPTLWQYLAGAISPLTATDDFLIGGSATASAKFQVNGTTGALTISPSTNLTTGNVLGVAFPASTSQGAGALTGLKLDLSTNLSAASGQTLNGINLTLPALSTTANTTIFNGFNLSAAGALQNGTAGSFTWNGGNIVMPNITQAAGGTVTSSGLKVTTGSITTDGTEYGLNVAASGISTGTLYGLNIGSITGGNGTEYGIKIGNGWDTQISLGSPKSNSTGIAAPVPQAYSGDMFYIPGAYNITSGKALSIDTGNSIASTSDFDFAGKLISAGSGPNGITSSAANTWNWSGNFLDLNRNMKTNHASAVINLSGDVATFSSNCTETLGNCTDNSNILQLTQGFGKATGAVLDITSSGLGSLINANGAAGGNALMVLNQTADQDILTASASGATKFTISNTGALTMAPAGTTAVNNSRMLNINSTTGLVSYEDSSAWDRNMWDDVTFENLATASASIGLFNKWQYLAGTLSPTIATDDLLIGGSATASAKFQVNGTTGAASLTARSAPTANMFSLSNAGFGTATNGVNGLDLNFVQAINSAADTNSAINIALTGSDDTNATDTLNGINITSTDATNVTQDLNGIYLGSLNGSWNNAIAIKIGSGWDSGLTSLSNASFTTTNKFAGNFNAQNVTSNNVDALYATISSNSDNAPDTNSALRVQLVNTAQDNGDVLNGINITANAPQTVTGGTQNLIFVDPAASGNSAGSLYGIKIDSITTPGNALETAMSIGSGWDYAAAMLGKVGIGTTTPIANFTLTNSSFTNLPVTGKSLAIFDQYENQPILSASSSGISRFTINNDGSFISSANPIDWTLNNAVDALNIDSNTLSLDALNNRLGIGTATPAQALDVVGNFQISDSATSPTKAYRFRTNGSALDLEAAGAQLTLSNWSNADFSGTQRNYLILENGASIAQALNTWQWRTAANGTTRHAIDGNTAANVNFNLNNEATNFSIGGSNGDDNLFIVNGTSNNIGVGAGSAPASRLHVSGNYAGNALVTFDDTSATNDILTASASGVTKFVIANNGQLGVNSDKTSDYLANFYGGTANNFSRLLNLTQSNNSSEDTYGLYLSSTNDKGNITGSTNTKDYGSYLTMTPSIIIGDGNQPVGNIWGNYNNISLDSTKILLSDNSIGGNELKVYGDQNNVSGTVNINNTGNGYSYILGIASKNTIAMQPQLTSISPDSVFESYAGMFDNTSFTNGNSNLEAKVYGIEASAISNLTAVGDTAHYGGKFGASGTAVNNYGIYTYAQDATNNYGLYVAHGTSVFTNNIYSPASRQALAIFNQNESQDILTASASGVPQLVLSRTGDLTLGKAGTNQGSLILANTSANLVTLKSSNSTAASGYTLTLPTTAGNNNEYLKTDGSGNLSWSNPSTSVGLNVWQYLAGAISPLTATDDFLIGGSATSSAKFAVNGTTGAVALTPSTGLTTGNILGVSFPSSTTQGSGTLTGFNLDLATNLTALSGQTLNGVNLTLPALTTTANTTVFNGFNISAAGALSNGTAGSIAWNGGNIVMPNITQSAGGSVTSSGIKIATGSITTGGNEYGINIAATGVSNGVLRGINISSITASTGSERGIYIGGGWDEGIYVSTPTSTGSYISLGAPPNSYQGSEILIPTVYNLNSGRGILLGENGSSSNSINYDFSGDMILVQPSNLLTLDGTNVVDWAWSGNFLDLNRNMAVNNSNGSITLTGDIATLRSNCTETSGTCTDTSNILQLTQSFGKATGAVLDITSSGLGSLINANGTAGGNALMVLNQTGAQDILTASASGVTQMTLSRTGDLTLGKAGTNQGSLILANTSANLVTLKSSNSTAASGYTLTLPTTAGNNNEYLRTDGSGNLSWSNPSTSVGLNVWQYLAGAISPLTATDDFLIGGSATASAKFAVNGTTGALAIKPSTNLVSGTIADISFPAATSLTGGIIGLNLDLNTNLTPTQLDNVIGIQLTTPSLAITNDNSFSHNGMLIQGNNITENSAGAEFSWSGLTINSPQITKTNGNSLDSLGAVITNSNIVTDGNATGLKIINGSISGNGNQAGLWVAASRTTVGTLKGIDISNIASGTNSTATALSIGDGWNYAAGLLGKVGIGTATPVSDFTLSNSSFTNLPVTGKSLALFDQYENQDIFTASASGVTQMTLSRTGDLTLGKAGVSAGSLVLANTSANVVTLKSSNSTAASGYTLTLPTTAGNNNEYLKTDGSGNLSWSNPSTSVGLNVWQYLAGAISPLTATDDFMVGGSATASAKFAVNGTTGESFLKSSTITTGNLFALDVGTNDTLTSGNLLKVSSQMANTTFTGNLASVDWSPDGTTNIVNSGDLMHLNIGQYGDLTNLLNITDNGSTVFSVSETAVTSNLPASFNAVGDVALAYDLSFNNQNTSNIKTKSPFTIDVGDNYESNSLTLKTYNAGQIVADMTDNGQFLISSNISNAANVGLLDVYGAKTGQALAVFNVTNNQDILTASASGVTKFAITNNGSLVLGNASANAVTFKSSDTTAAPYTLTLPTTAGNANEYLKTDGSGNLSWSNPSTSVGLNVWQYLAGAISPLNATDDFILGGTATASAKFQFNGQTGQTIFNTSNATGTTTSAGVVMNHNSLTTGTGTYMSSSSITTGNLMRLDVGTNDTLTSGNLLSLTSQMANTTFTGNLEYIDWSPDGSSLIANTGDLLHLNIGANGDLTNLLNITDNGSTVFSVAENQITSAVPQAFTAAGDVAVAYDLNFTNSTSSNIKSSGPLTLVSGEAFANNNLNVTTYGTGNVVFNTGASGTLVSLNTYTAAVGATNTALSIDNTGKIGVVGSSIRFKENVNDMENVDWLYQLRPVNFTYKTDDQHLKQYGMIAEEVAQVNPAFVLKDQNDTPFTVAYQNLISPMLKALQDQHAEIASISSQLKDLQLVSGSNLAINDNATISGTLTVSGTTLLADTNITGDLSVGVLQLKALEGSVNSLTGLLTLQNSVTVDDRGNIITAGEITASKINVSTPDVLSASVGKAVLPTGTTQLTIDTTAVSTSSAIFVTPEDPVTVSASATDSGRFTIKVPATLSKDLKVNWWIIN